MDPPRCRYRGVGLMDPVTRNGLIVLAIGLASLVGFAYLITP